MTQDHDPRPTRTSTVDAADELRKEWQLNAPPASEEVDTAELPPADARYFDDDGWHDYWAAETVRGLLAQQREAGMREGKAESDRWYGICMNTAGVDSLWARVAKAEAALATRQPVAPELKDERFSFELAAKKGLSHTITGIDFQRNDYDDYKWAATRRLYDFWKEAGSTAVRFAKASTVAPVSELTDEQIAGIMGWRGPGAYTAATLRKIRAVLAASPKAEPVSDDKRDAERYRWLRNEASGRHMAFMPYGVPAKIDAVIDAAIAATPPQPTPTKESK